MKIIKQASVYIEILEMEVPFPWYVKLFRSIKWQKENVKILNVSGNRTWNTVIFDFENTPFELGVSIDQIKIDDSVYRGVVPLTIDPVNPTIVECTIESASYFARYDIRRTPA